MTSWLLVAAWAVVVAAQSVTPSSRPDFSGTWQLDPARSESSAQGSGSGPVRAIIQQTDKAVIVETVTGGNRWRATYPVTEPPAAAPGVDVTSEGRAYWTGTALVTEGTRVIQGQTVAVKETRSLNPAGTEMTVEAIVIVQHGYQFRGARNYGAGRDVYVKVSP